MLVIPPFWILINVFSPRFIILSVTKICSAKERRNIFSIPNFCLQLRKVKDLNAQITSSKVGEGKELPTVIISPPLPPYPLFHQ